MARGIKNLLGLFLLLAAVAACEHKASPNNKVTITPSATTSQPELAMPSGVDKSPMDMSYYPVDYPKLKMSGHVPEPLVARVIYSRPQKGGRQIFGSVLKYGVPWRLGANEATEIEFFKDVKITNKAVSKGRYILYCIPFEDRWKLIINSDLYTWGLKIDSTKDVRSFEIPIARTNFPFEVFTMDFEKTGEGMQLIMEWDSVRAALPITY
jgi:hypothetical protein